MKRTLSIALLLTIYLAVKAQPRLPYFISNGMVLQQQTNVNVWGWDKPGTTVKITASWNKQTVSTKTNADGKWMTHVATPAAGGPYELVISNGKAVTLSDILIGEVWLCTGQSNMEMAMKGFKNQPIMNSNAAIITSKNKNIRLFTVPRSSVTETRDTVKNNTWQIAAPEAVSNFSATGYYFGRMLSNMLDVPIGLINDSYGGSTVQAWMSAETLKSFPEIKVPAKTDTIKNQSQTPTTLYNGMIHPVVGFTIKGCIWYQGESNKDAPDLYERLFPAMVKQWRTEWNQGDFPFYYAQIAPYDYNPNPPTSFNAKANSAYIRDAQRKSVRNIPNSAMAVLMDIGEQKSIHPMRKQEGGERLALLALANTYNMKGFGYQSPQYDSMNVVGSTANLFFSHAKNGLTAFGKPLSLFEIAGANKVFHPAQAIITNNGIAVSAPQVTTPVAVRYAFKDFIIGDLFSNEGLPVSSFRTDDW
jgi:sialate O-acetylesterase